MDRESYEREFRAGIGVRHLYQAKAEGRPEGDRGEPALLLARITRPSASTPVDSFKALMNRQMEPALDALYLFLGFSASRDHRPDQQPHGQRNGAQPGIRIMRAVGAQKKSDRLDRRRGKPSHLRPGLDPQPSRRDSA